MEKVKMLAIQILVIATGTLLAFKIKSSMDKAKLTMNK